jgi:threonine dehydrogenase-like Zn-dependent dehydrogenase
LDPNASGVIEEVIALVQGARAYRGADLVYEVSGNPDALDQAIAVTGYNGRVVIGSWYGRKPATLRLGGSFHRSRIRLISSQVSSIEPERRGRWSRERLQQFAWHMVKELKPSRFITHRFPLSEAAKAYQLLDRDAQEALQVVLTY